MTTAPRDGLRVLVAALAVLAALRLGAGYHALLFAEAAQRSDGPFISAGPGAVDLMARRFETGDYFGSVKIGRNVYPPASYAMLWPFVSAASIPLVRWTWALVLTGSFAWLCRTCARASGFADPLARLAFGMLPLTFLATSSSISTGQLSPVVIALLVASVVRFARFSGARHDGAIGAALFTLASVKPTLAAPFGWLLLFVPRSLGPSFLASAFYGGLTAVSLLARRIRVGSAPALPAAVTGAHVRVPSLEITRKMFAPGYSNLQNLFVFMGYDRPFVFLPPLVATALLGPWAWRHRRDDPWVLLGVTGLVARFAFYHRGYDDLLVVPALVALARLVSGAMILPGGGRATVPPRIARVAFAVLLAAVVPMLLPRDFPPKEIRGMASTAGWGAALLLLGFVARPGRLAAADA